MGPELPDYLSNDFKLYVEVNEDRMPDGTVLPRSFVWEDGVRYEVDRILDVRPAVSLKAGGAGLRYKVRVAGKETFMFLEEAGGVAGWFMERASY